MTINWFLRIIYMLFWLTLSANFPFFGIGMIWGLPAIVILSVWLGLSWHWQDNPTLLMFKTWFIGFLVISAIEVLRQYHLMDSEGVEAYLVKLKWSIGLSLITLFFSGLTLYVVQRIIQGLNRLFDFIDLWLAKETALYHKTWVYRKVVKFQKKIRGVQWRLKNWYEKYKTPSK